MSTSQKMIECDVMETHATLIGFLSIQNVVLYETFLLRALKIKFLNVIHLRNEFHFSGVHGAMNRSGSRAK